MDRRHHDRGYLEIDEILGEKYIESEGVLDESVDREGHEIDELVVAEGEELPDHRNDTRAQHRGHAHQKHVHPRHAHQKHAHHEHRHEMKEKYVEAIECEPFDPEPIPDFPNFGHINLIGVINCRDLGGIPTKDGRHIKKRSLLRSADLHEATEIDIEQLKTMHGLAYVVDLRADFEVGHEPDALEHMRDIEYVNLPALSDGAIGFTGLKHLGHDLKTVTEMAHDPFQLVRELYPKSLLGEYGMYAYSRLLHHLLENDDGATLWHCTQGKDRTGIGAILVEYSLGVPKEYILMDYLATNLFVKGWMEKMERTMRRNPVLRSLGLDLEAYAFANPNYFDRAFEAVNDEYGSMDNYLLRALDFGPDKQAALREKYLV